MSDDYKPSWMDLSWYRVTDPQALYSRVMNSVPLGQVWDMGSRVEKALIGIVARGGLTFLDYRPEDDQKICHLLREAFCNPATPVDWNQPWVTPEILAMAKALVDKPEDNEILADRMEELGCQNELVLQHLRGFDPFMDQYFDPDEEPIGFSYLQWVPKPIPCTRDCWVLHGIMDLVSKKPHAPRLYIVSTMPLD